MEFWDGRERHTSPYAKYRTVPGWSSSSHTYPNKPLESRSEGQGWMGEPSSWAIPGSRTGGTIRDYVNWTDLIPPSNCPAENQPLAAHAGHERSFERQRAQMERQREKERLIQRGEWTNKWQTGSSTLHRREKEKLSSNSYRELEAWANRYYHSLPRQRRAEARTWSTTQWAPDSDNMPRSTSRLVSAEPNQRPPTNTAAPYNPDRCNLDNRLRVQLERWKAQQPPAYMSAKQSLSRKTSNSKENVSLRPSFSQPPNYTHPPPYAIPPDSNNPTTPERLTAKTSAEPGMEYTVGSRTIPSVFPTLRRTQHCVPLAHGGPHPDHSGSDRTPRAAAYSDSDQAGQNLLSSPTLSESLTARQPVQKPDARISEPPHCFPEECETPSSDVALKKQSKLTRRRGGEMVFCLVSRMGEVAGLSSSPDEPLKSQSLPLLKVSAPAATADVAKPVDVTETCERQEPVQLADEVDSGGVTTQQCGSLMPIQLENAPEGHSGDSQTQTSDCRFIEKQQNDVKLLTQLAENRSFIPRKKDEEPDTGTFHKGPKNTDPCASSKSETGSLVAPQTQTTMKFPLWKEPKWHYCSKGVLEKKNEDMSNVGQYEQAVGGQPKKGDAKESAVRDKSRGLVVIDASCVVVKVEFIFPPEKERVQYVCSRSTDSYDHASDSLNLQVQTNDHNNTDTPSATEKNPLTRNNAQELYVTVQDQHTDDVINQNLTLSSGETVMEDSSQMSNDLMPNVVISENETFEERAERILGITLQNSSNEGQTLDELSQTSQTGKGNVQNVLGGSSKSPERETDKVEDPESILKGAFTSENGETTTNETFTVVKEKESPILMENVDDTVEEPEMNISDVVKTVQTHEMMAMDVAEQDNEGMSEDNKHLDEHFATKHTTVRVDSVTEVPQRLKEEDKVNACTFDELHELRNLLPTLLDNFEERTSESLEKEGSHREENPSCERNDVNDLCPTLLEDSGEIFDQVCSPSEGNLSGEADDLQNFCPTFFGDVENTDEYFGQECSPTEGSSPCATDDVNNHSLVLLENIHDSLSLKSSSSEDKPLNPEAGVNSLAPLVEIYMQDTNQLFGQEDAANLSDENDVVKTENTSELFDQKGSHNENHLPDGTNDMQILHPTLLSNSVEKISELFSQEAHSVEDLPSGETDHVHFPCLLLPHDNVDPFDKEGAPTEGNLSDKPDGIENLCPRVLYNYAENTSQFDEDSSTKGASISDEIQNVCQSLLGSSLESVSKLFIQEEACRDDPSNNIDDVNTHCPPLTLDNVENTGEPLVKESSLSDETDNMQNVLSCLSILCSSEESTSGLFEQECRPKRDSPSNERGDVNDLVLPHDNVEITSGPFGEEGVPWEDKLSDEAGNTEILCSTVLDNGSQLFGQEACTMCAKNTEEEDDIQNLCSSLCDSSVENTCEFFGQEPGRPWDSVSSNKTGDVSHPCSPLFSTNMEDTRYLLGQEGNETNLRSTLDLHTPGKRESTCQSPLESSHCLSESLTVTSHSDHLPELPLPPSSDADTNQQSLLDSAIMPNCGSSTFPSPPLTPVLLAHSRPPESSSLTSEVCSRGPPVSAKCVKEKQYPKSLWDAVNRIRKHTAPDSENEEEEGAELWEQMENTCVEADTELQPQESVLEERMDTLMEGYDGHNLKKAFIASDMVDLPGDENILLEEEGDVREVVRTAALSVEKTEVVQAEDDALSSCSLDSHSSKGTVIEGKEILESDKEDE